MQKQLSIKSELKDNRTKAIVVSVLTIIEIVINIINLVQKTGSYGISTILMGIILGIGDALTFTALITMINKPVLSILILLFAQIPSFIYAAIIAGGILGALQDMSMSLLIITVALVVHFIIANKNNKKTEEWKDKKITKKIVANINYDRSILKVPVWSKIIVYSLLVTVIMTYANSKTLTSMYSSILLRVLISTSAIVPMFLIISIVTTSHLAYEILTINTLFNGCIVAQLIIGKEASVIQIIQSLTEVVLTIYCWLLLISDKADTEKEKGKTYEK